MLLHMIQVFTERIFSFRLLLIKTNTTLNSSFYKIYAQIYFFRQEIKTDIIRTNFLAAKENFSHVLSFGQQQYKFFSHVLIFAHVNFS